VLGLTPDQQKQLILSIGSHRASRLLTPLEVGLLLRASMSAGSTPQELAASVQLDGPSMIARFVRLLELPSDIHHLVDWGSSQSTVGFTAASELARLKSHEEQRYAISAALENRLSSSEVKQIVQTRLRSRKAIEECVADGSRMRPSVERIHLFIGSVVNPLARERLMKLTQHERDKVLVDIIGRLYPTLNRLSSRLGVARFTITGDDSDSAALKTGTVDFETKINSELDKHLLINE
jgi:hypothetical protein